MGLFFYRKSPIISFKESFEYPNWIGTYDTGSIIYPSFTGSAIRTESYEYPSWIGTYDTGSIIYPSFTGSVIFTETYDSGSWP